MPDTPLALDWADDDQRNERLHQFAHALKNRLGSIWQAAALLHDLPEGPERRLLLDLAEKNYFQGARELEALLDDFRVPRGVTKLQRAPLDLAAVVQRSIANNAFRTRKKEQEVRFMQEPAIVDGDAQVLEQLFDALLSNASKFSPQGASVEVALRRDGNSAVVEVLDHGVGLAEADLKQVFTRYALLGSRSTAGESQARSTLARARQWAELHGGTLSANSQGPGYGSTFTATLPLVRQHQQ
ncbi:MAG TPA: HAMP domain-containing sensor histidine kinase [Flavobacteriales bacterium]|nr:HAMP domain-containing sensor histidine kinase [Flavobacteriales bacterium]